MNMHSLAMTRVYHMAQATETPLTDRHLGVLEYAWHYYRKNSVGPLFHNIRSNTGVNKNEVGELFPNGISSVYTWVGIPIQSTKSGCKPIATIEVENPREVYFDNNATTPLRQEVVDAMVDFLQDPTSYGNPSSSYGVGSQAFDVLERARLQVANCLNVNTGEISFVGSGSEANNMAIKGVAARHRHTGGHIVTTAVEHPSVLETVKFMGEEGFDITLLAVEPDGTLPVERVKDAIRDDTILVSIMAANNEIGTIYPLAEIGDVCRTRGIPFMVDAIQAFGKIPIKPKDMGISMLTMSGHKIYAPKGVAALFIDSEMEIDPLIHGGSQEAGLRAGTENVVGIMAMGLASKLICDERERETERLLDLQAKFLSKLHNRIPGAIVNGTLDSRLAHNLSIGFPGVDSGSLLLSLNQIGVAVSSGSACSAGSNKHSHVLDAIGVDSEKYGTIRFSFGKASSEDDIDYMFEHLPKLMEQLQA